MGERTHFHESSCCLDGSGNAMEALLNKLEKMSYTIHYGGIVMACTWRCRLRRAFVCVWRALHRLSAGLTARHPGSHGLRYQIDSYSRNRPKKLCICFLFFFLFNRAWMAGQFSVCPCMWMRGGFAQKVKLIPRLPSGRGAFTQLKGMTDDFLLF